MYPRASLISFLKRLSKVINCQFKTADKCILGLTEHQELRTAGNVTTRHFHLHCCIYTVLTYQRINLERNIQRLLKLTR